MFPSLSNLLSSDSRALQAGIGALVVLIFLAAIYGLYRLAFAHRLRAPGASRASYLCDGRLYPGDAG